MEQTLERKYPVGIQTFERLRMENYLYIDKTDLVWRMTKESPFVFLSRPRRFGKSLLTTTLDSYFKGDKELFEGLKIMELEKEWKQYPVIHMDLSVTKGKESASELHRALLLLLEPLEEQYGKIKNKYDILYRELKIEKTEKWSIFIAIVLVITLILNILTTIIYL